ncbi:MAG: hypothetical protein ACI92Z_001119 [Paracoccaceae bacterium]|jgi:uncharacterized protein YggE
MKRLLFILTAMSLTIAGTVSSEPAPRQITVTGTGEIAAAPDMATITLGVTNEDVDAAVAMAATSNAVAAILDRLEGMEIAGRDMQTQQFSIRPVWSNRSSDSNGTSKITGFQASNMVLVRIRDLAKLGGVLDAVIADGANDFSGLQFSIQNPDPLSEKAQQAAVADATASAKLLTSAAGVSLGMVLSITEQGGRGQPMMMASARESGGAIAAGEVTINASVTMVFQIEN